MVKNNHSRDIALRRGNIVWVDFGIYANRSKQGGIRPACIVSNNKCNEHSPVVTVVPITSKSKKKGLPTHIDVDKKDASGLIRDSVALTEQIQSIDKMDIRKVSGMITNQSVMKKITGGIAIQCGIYLMPELD
ncbi:type II toxin-antitoxin system PemK/MazF family toxin [[Clostridium] fimetarium]|uniref:mRNA interferase n=1 Tax=[Clostridium] fimetarium TaxID=99656 RepID=A0A1I0NF74_9FIRM|nr:type II toxin-antitoxin system PemK/MazF family toxin [[Clostridium] fimetarium]SEV99669.1 mRNA interferase MazF [[Clostridium] fimetarium]